MSRRFPWLWVVVGLLLVLPVLPVTVLRLAGADGDLAKVLVAFTPLALLPYTVALVLLVVALVSGHRRWVELGMTALVVVLLALHLTWFAPLVVGGGPDPAPGAERLTVMSANLQFGRGDAGTVATAVRDDDVDVLVLSEVTPEFVSRLDAEGIAGQLPYRVGEPSPGVPGMVVLAAQPIEEVDRADTAFDSLVVRTAGLTMLATHPVPPTQDTWLREQEIVLAAAREHDVDVVVGDLNATLDHPTVRDLVDAGWRDAVELTGGGWSPTWPVGGNRQLPFAMVQIDHVLVRDTLAVTDVETRDVPGSDHRAVLATLAPAE